MMKTLALASYSLAPLFFACAWFSFGRRWNAGEFSWFWFAALLLTAALAAFVSWRGAKAICS